ncbi:MAG: hypothetical protein AAF581_05365 [Planctomycetota bacterium]
MSIQYRCRCGQEVTLRSREPVYLVVGLVLGLTVLNSILLVMLWTRTGSDTEPPLETAAQSPVTPRGAPASGRPAATTLDPTDGAGTPTPPPIAEPTATTADVDAPVAAPIEAEVNAEAVPTDAVVTGTNGGAARIEANNRGATALPPAVGTTPVDDSARPVAISLPLPTNLDAVLLWACVQSPATDDIDRLAGYLAAAAWGSGFLREAAVARLVSSDDYAWLTAAVQQPIGTELSILAPAARGPIVENLQARWSELWPRAQERLPASVATWRSAIHPARPRDLLLLVDLSESMAGELATLQQALAAQLPLLADPAAGRRWGWIGYRDEVVDSFALTADVDAFLASTTSWRAEGGGDVPEGVDRAIFEALRFQSFSWQPDSEHALVVIGDAPPPYDRIAAMVALVEGAHGSPEKHVCHTIGFLREKEYRSVPGFRELAKAGGGRVNFFSPGEDVRETLWSLLAGARSAPWAQRPWPAP